MAPHPPVLRLCTTPPARTLCVQSANATRRLVDHEQRLSFAVIIGSFRGRGGKELDQHYVSLSYLHEPKGGILPAEAEEEDPEGGGTPGGGSQGDNGEGGGGGAGGAGSPPRSRSSEIARRFSRWIREQRLAVLRGFGADEEEEGEGRVESNGAGADGDSSASGGVMGDAGGVGVEGAEDGTPDGANSGEEGGGPVAGAGAGGESSATDDRDTDARGNPDPLVKVEDEEEGEGPGAGEEEEEEEQQEQQGVGLGGDAAPDDDEVEGDAEGGAGGWPGAGRDWFERGEDAKLVDAVRGPRAESSQLFPAPDREEAVLEVGAGEGRGDRTAGDVGGKSTPGKGLPDGFPVQPPDTADPDSDRLFPQQEEESDERTHTFHAFPPAETVTISRRGEPVESAPNPRNDPNFTWEADGIG